MVHSNNIADFHNQNSVDDKKWDQSSRQVCTLIFFSINMKKVLVLFSNSHELKEIPQLK